MRGTGSTYKKQKWQFNTRELRAKLKLLLTFHDGPNRSNKIENLAFHRWRFKAVLLH